LAQENTSFWHFTLALAQGDTLKNIQAGATPQNTLTKKIGR
jgi:hypothetical protein